MKKDRLSGIFRARFPFGMMALIVGAMLALTLVGCPVAVGGGGPVSTSPESMDKYVNDEPEMAPNPNRAVARAGGTVQVAIPDYLVPTVSPNIRAVTTGAGATFRVHPDDTSIAQIVSQNGSTCSVRGLQVGSARIIITVGGQSATVIMAVSPSQGFYTLPAGAVRRLGEREFLTRWWANPSDQPDGLPDDYQNYISEPTCQLAWNWRNKGNEHGASGEDSGIDILTYFVDPSENGQRGWVRTTYGHGGWHYDLNGVTNNMTNGVQVEGNVELRLKPEFIYDNGVPYLQITHTLTNKGNSPLTGQKFGASADVMIFNQDDAPITYLPYGALMTNENTKDGIHYLATLKLRLVCQGVQGIDNVSTMYLGEYPGERDHVYEDKRESITARDDLDTALNFSYQDITLGPRESKTFVVRFTQVQ